MFSSTLRICVLATMAIIGAVNATPSSVMILGSASSSSACVGIPISTRHLLVTSACVSANDPLVTASHLEETFRSHAVMNTSTFTSGDHALHLVTLQEPLAPSVKCCVMLPDIRQLDKCCVHPSQSATSSVLMNVDPSTGRVWYTDNVVVGDPSSCDHPVCVKSPSLDPVAAQYASFLLQHDQERQNTLLLGHGVTQEANAAGFHGFSWLPNMLASPEMQSYSW
ncbi:hypothetical protein Poli38472_011493 [Pythium oligandrum]|uniref:Peptidase S1 domain-containing protein n=1 Tax=Pythium oligandrum TaxID=41045 RepID=A0A8K1CLN1_PYTOL|nr:hypothetical protein Poli38472_011493 [Pythium oligandrum]|eukprot:TMW64613.1 hypothetical protein Poli38472_011493 [Pythium oligandrum]